MTCDEVKKVMSERDADECTRGERAAVYAHLVKCPDCVRFMKSLHRQMTRAQRRASNNGGAELTVRDLQDPEFVRTVFGGER